MNAGAGQLDRRLLQVLRFGSEARQCRTALRKQEQGAPSDGAGEIAQNRQRSQAVVARSCSEIVVMLERIGFANPMAVDAPASTETSRLQCSAVPV